MIRNQHWWAIKHHIGQGWQTLSWLLPYSLLFSKSEAGRYHLRWVGQSELMSFSFCSYEQWINSAGISGKHGVGKYREEIFSLPSALSHGFNSALSSLTWNDSCLSSFCNRNFILFFWKEQHQQVKEKQKQKLPLHWRNALKKYPSAYLCVFPYSLQLG